MLDKLHIEQSKSRAHHCGDNGLVEAKNGAVIRKHNGKQRRIYLRWATPFEMFRELPGCEKHLRPGVTLAELDRFAQSQSDTEAALAMQSAKRKLF